MNAVTKHQSKSRRMRRAISIVEALLASMILAIVASSAMLPFAAGMQNILEAGKLERAVSLGQGLMEEILARPFDEVASTVTRTAPVTGDKNRANYSTIKQFNGYSESDKEARDFKGNAIASNWVDGYWRTATVTGVTYPEQNPADVGNLVRVDVFVYLDDALMVKLSRLVAREY